MERETEALKYLLPKSIPIPVRIQPPPKKGWEKHLLCRRCGFGTGSGRGKSIDVHYRYCPNCGQAIKYSILWTVEAADQEFQKIIEVITSRLEVKAACEEHIADWRKIHRAIVFGDEI